MMPVIQAEEMMSAITVAAVGGGNLEKEDSKKIMRELRQQGRRTKDEGREMINREARRAALAAMGIVIENKKEK